MSEKFAEWFLEVRWPGAGTACRWPIGKMTDADFLRLTAEAYPAAPCSTLPDEDELFQRVEAAIRLAAELGIDSVYDFVHGRGMKLYRERIRDEIAALRSQLSSCETELKQARVENAALIQAMIDVRARLGQMLTDSQSAIRTHIAP